MKAKLIDSQLWGIVPVPRQHMRIKPSSWRHSGHLGVSLWHTHVNSSFLPPSRTPTPVAVLGPCPCTAVGWILRVWPLQQLSGAPCTLPFTCSGAPFWQKFPFLLEISWQEPEHEQASCGRQEPCNLKAQINEIWFFLFTSCALLRLRKKPRRVSSVLQEGVQSKIP